MMLQEKLKQELDKLNEEQLQKIAEFIAFIEFQAKQAELSTPLWQKITPVERAKEFREWVSQLPKTNLSLPNEAFSRESIYEEWPNTCLIPMLFCVSVTPSIDNIALQQIQYLI